MEFDTTLNNISVISWRSVLLMEENLLPGENHRPQVTVNLYHTFFIEYNSSWVEFELTTLVVIWIGIC